MALPILFGLPLYVESSWLVGVLATIGGTLCVIAVLRASLSFATAGGTFALISLAVALRQTPSSTNVLLPFLFGLALLVLVDGVHLASRLEGAAVTRILWRRHLAWWSARAAISLGVAIVIALVAPVIALALPLLWGPFLAGVGVLLAVAAALAFVGMILEE